MTTAIRMGAVSSAPTWDMNAASSTIENGAITSDPGTAASMHVNASPIGTLVNTSWTRRRLSPDEQRGENRPADEPAGLAHREGEYLGDNECDEQAHAQGSRILDDGAELIASGEHREWQRHADDAEHRAADRRPDDAVRFTLSNSRDASFRAMPSNVTMTAASRPNATPASSCQSSNSYAGTA